MRRRAASVDLLDRHAVRTIGSVGLTGPTPLALFERTVAKPGLSMAIDTHTDPDLAQQSWRFHDGVPQVSEGAAPGTEACFPNDRA